MLEGPESQTIFEDTSWTFDTIWHPALLASSACAVQGHLNDWISDFIHSSNQCVAYGTLPSHLPMEAGVPYCSVLGPVWLYIYINDLSDALENPLFLFTDNSRIVLL